jgi:hypothetical protein
MQEENNSMKMIDTSCIQFSSLDSPDTDDDISNGLVDYHGSCIENDTMDGYSLSSFTDNHLLFQ